MLCYICRVEGSVSSGHSDSHTTFGIFELAMRGKMPQLTSNDMSNLSVTRNHLYYDSCKTISSHGLAHRVKIDAL